MKTQDKILELHHIAKRLPYGLKCEIINYYNGKTVKCIDKIRRVHSDMCEKLLEWHFDVDGLIESGLAVSVLELEQNPYEL